MFSFGVRGKGFVRAFTLRGHQEQVAWKLVNANPRLRVKRVLIFSLMLRVVSDYLSSKLKDNNIDRNPLRKIRKLKSKFSLILQIMSVKQIKSVDKYPSILLRQRRLFLYNQIAGWNLLGYILCSEVKIEQVKIILSEELD